MRIELHSYVRVVPQDRLVYSEAVRLGEVDAREATESLVVDAVVFLDQAELNKIAALPDVAHSMSNVVEPQKPVYKTNDWRAQRYSASREAQWQKKPIINYIVNNYKNDIIKAVQDAFKIPADWKALLFQNVTYRAEPKTLQLSPTDDKQWQQVFVQVIADLGSADNQSGFLGRFGAEVKAASDGQQVTKEGDLYTLQTTLTGFDSAMKAIDPYSGAKLSNTKNSAGWDIADEPGYDKEIKSAFIDHFSTVVSQYFIDAVVREIRDNGQITFTAADAMPVDDSPPEPELPPI